MKHALAASIGLAGLLHAQLGAPGGSNLGVPAVPGTRTPESSPATAVSPLQSPAPGGASDTGAGSTGAGTATAPMPGISFGAAPPPLISPNR